MLVNHKRVSRVLREDSLIAAALAEPRKKPRREMMVNLAGRMQVTGINQLWVADITQVRLKREFVFWPSFWISSHEEWSAGRLIGT
jgi:transposase InsO family protein